MATGDLGALPERFHFLVVDDEPDVLDSLRRLFRKDYTLFLALSAEEAFKILDQHEVHLVMSDQRMPEMSGVEFLARVKERFPLAVRMLFTGYSDVAAIIDAINEGHVYRYIHKPFDPAELKVIVAQAAQRFALLSERERLLQELGEQNEQLEKQNEDLQRAYSELKTLDRLKTVFMEVVSHELNTPTAIILGYSSLLQRDATIKANEGTLRSVEGIKGSGLRLKGITEKIGKMMAADAPSVALDLETVDTGALLSEVAGELAPILSVREQRLDLALAPDSLELRADRVYLKDLLMNLLVNAIKFSPDGQTIWLTARSAQLNGSAAVQFEVRDEGVGIRPEDRDQIFNPFFGTFRSRHHSSGDFGFQQRGIGLGLAIVKKFAEMHGGTVEFESEVDRGSQFSVVIPVQPPAAANRRKSV